MSREIVVREYLAGDLESIKEILLEYPSPTGWVWDGNKVEEMISDALREQPDGVFVSKVHGEMVGVAIVMHREWFNIAYLDYIQVKISHIKKGVGHELIERCIDWASEKGARMIYTETGMDNERAIRFYKRHGFEITGCIPEYYREGLDAVILVNKLR